MPNVCHDFIKIFKSLSLANLAVKIPTHLKLFTLLQIYHWMWTRNNFVNRRISYAVIMKKTWLTFWTKTCRHAVQYDNVSVFVCLSSHLETTEGDHRLISFAYFAGALMACCIAGVAADRIRIASSGKLRDTLSAQHLILCNHNHMQRGCSGGHIDRAWWYLRHYGSVIASVLSTACARF